ncbi:MAG: integrase core domain-containing protein [Chloroflexota bacterium]
MSTPAYQLSNRIVFACRPLPFLAFSSFDAVFQAHGIEVIHTPFQAPNANAFAERFVRSIRQECLDHLVLLGEWHVRRVLAEYVTFYNIRRPHQGLDQQCSVPLTIVPSDGLVQRRDV